MSRVTPELRAAIFERDKGCVLARLDPGHQCKDAWGNLIEFDSPYGLSLEHVKSDLRMGVRAESDERHLVVLCQHANLRVPSKYERGLLRSYLAAVTA